MKARGGFMPSVMGGVMRVGPYLTTAAVATGSRLLSRKSKGRKGLSKGHRAKSHKGRKGLSSLDSRRRGTRRTKRRSRRS